MRLSFTAKQPCWSFAENDARDAFWGEAHRQLPHKAPPRRPSVTLANRNMFVPNQPDQDPVECLLRNAELRNELEPLYDESIDSVDASSMTTRSENDFLESMLEWERAPMVPVAEWFEPTLRLEDHENLNDEQVQHVLANTVQDLFSKNIVLDFTDHLADRELYTLIARDILPAFEKKLNRSKTYLHWDCANTSDDPETWLRYYASHEERDVWFEETGGILPPCEQPPYLRRLPKAPM